MGDEEIGKEGGEKIEEEDKHDNLHRIERWVEVLRMLDIFLRRDETDDICIVYEEKWSDSDSEDKKYFVGFCHITEKSFFIHFLDGFSKKWEHRIEEQSSEHHSDFHYFHRDRVKSDGNIGSSMWFKNREEDNIDLEIDDIKKEGDPVGKRCFQNVFHIYRVESESNRFDFAGVKIEKPRHHDISKKPCEEYPYKSVELHRGTAVHKSFRNEYERDKEYREEIDNFSYCDGHKRKLGF